MPFHQLQQANAEIEVLQNRLNAVTVVAVPNVDPYQEEMLDLLLVALFTGGHVLLEGVPGIAKTLTAKLLAQVIHADFSRITFYSDSTNDLPLLEWATDPVATNPSPALAEIATARGWPVLNLFTKEEP